MFRLAKYPQVIELKGYYWWAGFVRNAWILVKKEEKFFPHARLFDHRRPRRRHSQLPTPLHRLQHRDFVGVLDVTADRNAHRNTSYLQSGAAQLA
jgi:hypothetical protein